MSARPLEAFRPKARPPDSSQDPALGHIARDVELAALLAVGDGDESVEFLGEPAEDALGDLGADFFGLHELGFVGLTEGVKGAEVFGMGLLLCAGLLSHAEAT